MQASAFEATVHDEERRALIRLEGDLDGNAGSPRRRLRRSGGPSTQFCRARLHPGRVHQQHRDRGDRGVLARARADQRDMSAFGLVTTTGRSSRSPGWPTSCTSIRTRNRRSRQRDVIGKWGHATVRGCNGRERGSGIRVIDIDGEVTAFSERVLMDAFARPAAKGCAP